MNDSRPKIYGDPSTPSHQAMATSAPISTSQPAGPSAPSRQGMAASAPIFASQQTDPPAPSHQATATSARISASQQTAPFLRKLPEEIRCAILSHLSAKQMQRARRVCKEFQATLDNASVLGPLHDRSISSLNAFKAAYVDVLPQSSKKLEIAVSNLAAWLARRPQHPSSTLLVLDFDFLWKYRCGGLVSTYVEYPTIFILILAVDLKFHPRAGNPAILKHVFGGELTADDHTAACADSKAFFDAVCSELSDNGVLNGVLMEQLFGTSAFTDWDALFVLLRDTPGGVFSGVNGLIGERQWPLRPALRLTGQSLFNETIIKALRGLGLYPDSYLDEQMAPLFRMEDVVNHLGAPLLPELETGLCYGMRTQWAWDMFQSVVDEGKTLDPMVKAAVLEELYIF